MEQSLLEIFTEFGLAGLIGFALGLERAMTGSENPHAGTRDFIMFGLLGAVSAYLGELLDNYWMVFGGFVGGLALLLSGYWIDRGRDSGITTEVAAILTYFLGVLIVLDAPEVAIALAIVTLIILSQKKSIDTISKKIQLFELQAAIKFLVITFIILPVLPGQPLSTTLLSHFGKVESVSVTGEQVRLVVDEEQQVAKGEKYTLYSKGEKVGQYQVEAVENGAVSGKFVEQGTKEKVTLEAGGTVDKSYGIEWLYIMLSAINPYKIWLIVVLVSMVSLVGYVSVKILGPGAGNGLTGLIGGLASSTVTTVSFARRSKENPEFNKSFGVAILLASSIMFPRLVLEIAIVNQALMRNMALPIMAMGGTGMLLALLYTLTGKKEKESPEQQAMKLDNPFCLKSAITFGLVFTGILVVTRLATSYFGNSWLPVVAIISGLVDADAIAFSLSDAQRAGIISLDWASFNLVLGALSNTMVKLAFVYMLGHRGLFRRLAVSFVVMGIVGIATTFLYYDIL